MKKLFVFLALLMFSLMLFGCGKETEKSAAAPTKGYTVKDAKGREFHFEKTPDRIICMSLAHQDILFEMLPPENFIAASANSVDGNYSLSAEQSKQVKNHYRSPITAEQVLKYQPDLFIASTTTLNEVVKTLEDMKIKVFYVKNARSYDEIKENVNLLAKLANTPEKGEAIIKRMDGQKKHLEEQLKSIPKKKLVVQLTYNGTYGMQQQTFGMLCDLAQTESGMRKMPVKANMPVSKEKLLELDPDVMFLPSWNNKGTANADDYFKQISTDPAYANMKCVKNKQIYKYPEKYRYCTSQYIVDGAKLMAQLVYPEYIK